MDDSGSAISESEADGPDTDKNEGSSSEPEEETGTEVGSRRSRSGSRSSGSRSGSNKDSSDEDSDDEKLEVFRKNPNMQQFREKQSSDDDDESRVGGSLMIADDDEVDPKMPVLEAEVESAPQESDDEDEVEAKHRKRKKRSEEYDEEDDRLEDDDYDLLEENLGVKVKRRKFKRIRNEVDSDDDENVGKRDKEAIANELFDSDEELLDVDNESVSRPSISNRENRQYGSDESEESDEDDFIVDDGGFTGNNKLGRCTDENLLAARDIFGMDFDYNEICAAGDDGDGSEDDEGEKRVPEKAKKSYQEIYEPAVLERAGMTLMQRAIRQADIPERLIAHGPKMSVEELEKITVQAVHAAQDNNVQVAPELEEEMEEEADWIFENLFKHEENKMLLEANDILKKQEKAETERLEKAKQEAKERAAAEKLAFEKEAAQEEFGSEVGSSVPLPPASSTRAAATWDEQEEEEHVFKRPDLILKPPPTKTIMSSIDEETWETDDGTSSVSVSVKSETVLASGDNRAPDIITSDYLESLSTAVRDEFTNLRLTFLRKIYKVVKFIRVRRFEVPFIATYQKDDVIGFSISDLWAIYKYDGIFLHFNRRKKSLIMQLNHMMDYIADEERTEIVERMLGQVENVKIPVELEDLYSAFKSTFSRELPGLRERLKEIRKQMNEAEREAGEGDGDSGKEVERRMPKFLTGGKSYKHLEEGGIDRLVVKFGLTPAQYGENLSAGYLRWDIQQPEETPFREALKLVTEVWPSATDILGAAKTMLALKISKDPLVRKTVRSVFAEGAHVSVRPTPKGIQVIDENHPVFRMKYLNRKPVSDFQEDQFLRLAVAETDKLIIITIGETLVGVNGQSYIAEAKEMFTKDEFSTSCQTWNKLRGEVIDTLFEEYLLPQFKKELRVNLLKQAKDFVLKASSDNFFNRIKIAPYQPKEEMSQDFTSIIAIAYDESNFEPAFACALDSHGAFIESLRMNNFTKRLIAVRENERLGKEGDLYMLKMFIGKWKPKVVVISGESKYAIVFKNEVKDLISELNVECNDPFPVISVEIGDNELGNVYASSTPGKEEFPDGHPTLRAAISLARRFLDPLCEYAQLFSLDDEILCLKFHPMQGHLSKEDLLEALEIVLINRTNEVGVDLNEINQYRHKANVLQFVSGLGRQKANYFLKLMKMNKWKLENRSQLIMMFHIGPITFINCAAFLKIDVKALGSDTEQYVEELDATRVHPEHYEWAKKMAKDALSLEDDEDEDEDEFGDANAVENVMEHPEKLAELKLEVFADQLRKIGFENKLLVLGDIAAEMANHFLDFRTPYEPPNDEELFYMLTKETPQTFCKGKLITATVIGTKRIRPDKFTLENAMPEKADIKKCPICFKSDFQALEELWVHFDSEACPGPAIGINIRFDNHVIGFIPTEKLSDRSVQDPNTRVREKQTLYCRIEDIVFDRFTVEATSRTSDLVDSDWFYKPKRDNYYDKFAESEHLMKLQNEKRRQRPTFVKRVIVHPCFKNVSFKEAVEDLETMDQGDVIIRPSSKAADRLTLSWKVGPSIIQNVDIIELGKPNAFAIGTSLVVDDETYEDLDEIIARCVNPMASHARDIMAYKYYRNVGNTKEAIAKYLRGEQDKNSNKIHYFIDASKEFPGKFTLNYLPTSRVFQEYLTVTPTGIRFRQLLFAGFTEMLAWFKTHYMEIPDTATGCQSVKELTADHYRVIFCGANVGAQQLPPRTPLPTMTPSYAIPLPSPIRNAAEVIAEGVKRNFGKDCPVTSALNS